MNIEVNLKVIGPPVIQNICGEWGLKVRNAETAVAMLYY